ncbi:hypothetical protein MCOR12_008981 [Pyricularia oryzae]|uniref:Dynactin arp1 p25 subunit n=1 Tax=Pyricularia oryzae TaxID=318829 RepID=A0A4P7NFW2_PYROR|nr:hypothetical protein MCOR12_008981 [Pyricularia oryzae]QBZ60795.1 hypothetical protein PoMZ_07737 [Pyricularia oryzae]
MVSVRYLVGAALAIASVSAFVLEPEDLLEQASRLLKRQEPGTPAYNCHNTCGQALRQGRFSGDARCSNDVFLTNYKNCLQCSGPDNHNIWTFYGNSVGSFGRACGLSTTPLSGKQPDVPEAIPAVEPGAAMTSATASSAAASSTGPRATTTPPAAPSSTSGASSAATTSPVSAPSSASASAGGGSATRTTASASGGASVGGGGSSTSRANAPTSAPVPAGAAAVAKNMASLAVAVVAVGAQLW